MEKIKQKCLIILLLVGICSFRQSAFADNFGDIVSGIPSVSNPGLIQKNLQQTFPQQKKLMPPHVIEEKQPAPSTAGFDKIHLKLTKVIFKGNTVFSDAELQPIFQSSINHTISLAELERLVGEITKKYRNEGYILSRAILPAQVIKTGIVTIQIIEGYISEVTVEGDAGLTKKLIEKYGQHIKTLRPLQFASLERDMLLMNDLPGIIEKAVIHPSKTVPGGAELLLVVERTKTQESLSYDNYGTRYIGPQEISVRGVLNSATMAGSSDSLRYATVPHNTELGFIEYVHTNPIGIKGLRLSLGGNYTETHPLFVLQPLDVKSRGVFAFADLNYPLLRTRAINVNVHTTFNYQNITSTILSLPFYNDKTRSLVIGTSFNSSDSFQGINNLSIDVEHGFKILGAEQHVNQSRLLGIPNFTKTVLNISRLQFLSDRFSLFGAIYGQYAFNPMLASEQYSYGGPDFGRGYDPSAIVGDDGLAGKIELRMNVLPEWRFLNTIQLYCFYDAGKIWNRDGINLPPVQDATSTGLGTRFNFTPQVTGNFYLAKPLTLPVATLVAVGDPGNPIRAFFQVVLTL